MSVEALKLIEEVQARRAARASLSAWIEYRGSPYKLAAHHRLMVDELEKVESGKGIRLMILMPPGSAKSTYGSVEFPTWYVGRNPERCVIAASNTTDLAERFARRVRNLVSDPKFRDVFGCGISADYGGAGSWETDRGGEYYAAGVESTIAGRRADLAIIDDPIKSQEDANSERSRDKKWEWYSNDLSPRLKPDACVVLITTHWHEDDIAGRLLPKSWAGESGEIECRDGNTWKVLCIQAECETVSDPLKRKIGEMLWPEWFSARYWNQFKLNRRTWASLYQQRPAPDAGILFRSDDMGTYESKPDGLMIIGATDAALTPDDGDWTEHGIAGVSNDGTIYLLDWWRGRVGPEEWIEKQLDLVAKWHPLAWFGEVGPIRRATEGRIRQRMIDRRAMVRMEWLPHIGDKTAKAQAIIAVAGMGRLLWPVASWVGEVQRQCLVFPAGSPDDAVDTLGMIGRGADTLGRQEENEYDYRKSAAMGIAI